MGPTTPNDIVRVEELVWALVAEAPQALAPMVDEKPKILPLMIPLEDARAMWMARNTTPTK